MQFVLQKRYNAAHFLGCLRASLYLQTDALAHTHTHSLFGK